MKNHKTMIALAAILFAANRQILASEGVKIISTPSGLFVSVDANNGAYEIAKKNPRWKFSGSLGQRMKNLQTSHGSDALGACEKISFEWNDGTLPMSGEIRLYDEKPAVLFSETCAAATKLPPAPFPSFTNLPENLHLFSYQPQTPKDDFFSPPRFAASDASTPWLMFDDAANALVISPASHFMVATMIGNGRQQVASGLNEKLRNLPAGFSQETILAFGKGINLTWDLWGESLRALQGGKRPNGDTDTILRYLGYWTDNFAYYYYNYDLTKGYAGTLQSLIEHYRREQIPIRYLQLDSWWYYKTFTNPDGTTGRAKSAKLPQGEWNRYGGLLEYRAHTNLFPNGLAAFQQSIGLPLVTHNRWVDLASPYREHYKISGVAAIDPQWWNDITSYLKTNGVVTYEQDWLDRIYDYSHGFVTNWEDADAFLDNMARACKEKGLTMQYCMPLPCHFLQGSKYDNLTTIRVSGDGFAPKHYENFLYDSRLAFSMGIWPWVDVFCSTETNNLLLATLSAGAFGIGDKIGAENKDNIFKAIRADGVIVKPDVPVMPTDQNYLADARGKKSPLLAATFTEHEGLNTEYVVAFNRSKSESEEFHFTPAELGLRGRVCVYDYFSGHGQRIKSGKTISGTLGTNGIAFYVVAPFGKSGIAFLGDAGKFVGTGKQRIAFLKDESGKLTASVLFVPTEKSVILHGYSLGAPKVSAQSGEANLLNYEPANGHFKIEVSTDSSAAPKDVDGDPARTTTVTLTTK